MLELLSEDTIRIVIDGKGISLDEYNAKENKANWEILFTDLYGIDKSKRKSNSKYGFSVGLPVAFVCAVQFCCEYMNVKVISDFKEHKLHFEKGINIGGLKSQEIKMDRNSTELEFKLDNEVFGEANILEAIEYFMALLEGYSLANNICFTLRFYKNGYKIERAYRNGHRCG